MVRTKAPLFFISIQQMTVVDRQAQISCSVVFVQMGFICCDTESRNEYNSAETGLYYVSSRYYDPETCRWINADSQLNCQSGVLGYNLFAYCENNPVNKFDPTGHFGIGTLIGGLVGGVIGGLSGALTAAVKGKSILAGAVTGAATGAFIGVVCGAAADAVATGGASVLVDAALLCGSAAAIGNLANQAWNYSIEKKQQPKTNKSNKANNNQGNSKAVSVTGKPASECDSFAEYVDLKSIAISGVAAAAFAPLGIGANCVVNSAFVGLESGASNIAGQVIANFAMGGNVSILQGIIDLF